MKHIFNRLDSVESAAIRMKEELEQLPNTLQITNATELHEFCKIYMTTQEFMEGIEGIDQGAVMLGSENITEDDDEQDVFKELFVLEDGTFAEVLCYGHDDHRRLHKQIIDPLAEGWTQDVIFEHVIMDVGDLFDTIKYEARRMKEKLSATYAFSDLKSCK